MAEQSKGTLATSLDEPHARFTLQMALLLLGAYLAYGLDLPWRVAGIVFSGLAVVQGVRAIVALRRHRRRHADVQAMGPAGGVLLALGVAVAAGLTVLQLLQVVLWPFVSEQEECRDRALTRTAVQRCDDALVDRLQQLGGLGG